MKELEHTQEEILGEIAQFYQLSEKRPGDVSTREIAEKLGVSTETARRLMSRLVRAGFFEMVKTSHGNRVLPVYRRVSKRP